MRAFSLSMRVVACRSSSGRARSGVRRGGDAGRAALLRSSAGVTRFFAFCQRAAAEGAGFAFGTCETVGCTSEVGLSLTSCDVAGCERRSSACATTRVAIGGVIALLASRVLAPLRGLVGRCVGELPGTGESIPVGRIVATLSRTGGGESAMRRIGESDIPAGRIVATLSSDTRPGRARRTSGHMKCPGSRGDTDGDAGAPCGLASLAGATLGGGGKASKSNETTRFMETTGTCGPCPCACATWCWGSLGLSRGDRCACAKTCQLCAGGALPETTSGLGWRFWITRRPGLRVRGRDGQDGGAAHIGCAASCTADISVP